MATRLLESKQTLHDARIAEEVLTFSDYKEDMILGADVIIVGSGAGGGAAAMTLAEAGLDVLILEEGPYVPTKDFTTSPTVQLRRLYRDAGTSMIRGNPNIVFAEGRCVGGSTVLWGGMMWRTPERILHRWHTEKGIPNILSKDMEPYFEHAERYMVAKGQVPESLGEDSRILHEGATNLGWSIKPNIRAQNHCIGTDNCMFGCPQGAKKSSLNTTIPRAVRLGARLMANVKVERVLTKYGRAAGVRGRFVDEYGQPSYRFEAYAPMVVLSAGARFTPGLLMKSGLRTKWLGKNLTTHPNGKVLGVFERRLDAWQGVHQGYQIDEFFDEGILLAIAMTPPALIAMSLPFYGKQLGEVMSDYNHMVSAGFLVEDSITGHVALDPFGTPTMYYNLSPYDVHRFLRGTALLAELFFATGAKKVITGLHPVPYLYSPDDIPKIFSTPIRPMDIESLTVHIMGSAHMGRDPKTSVTNEWGEHHEISNLFVADASLFPTGIGVNPGLSIQSLVYRNMTHVVENRWRYFARGKRPASGSSNGHLAAHANGTEKARS